MRVLCFLLGLLPVMACAEILKVFPAPFAGAHGMYVSPQGEIWLADTFKQKSSESYIYDIDGRAAGGALRGVGLSGIAKSPVRNLFALSDTMGSQVFLMDEYGIKLRTFAIPNPWNARWAPSGRTIFVVGHGGVVWSLDARGAAQESLRGLDAPFDIAPISEDAFWVSEQGAQDRDGRVCLYRRWPNSRGFFRQLCHSGFRLQNPEGLWALRDGSVLVVDTAAGSLLHVLLDGRVILIETNLGIPILVQALLTGEWFVFTNRFSEGPAVILGRSSSLP